jgi:hypothetical protein
MNRRRFTGELALVDFELGGDRALTARILYVASARSFTASCNGGGPPGNPASSSPHATSYGGE